MTATASIRDEVSLRPATQADLNFILSSWVKSYREHAGDMPGPIYYEGQRNLVTTLLQRCGATIACDPDDPSAIFGYVVSEKRGPVVVVHYVYVKHTLRRLGIARQLLAEVGARGCHYTHQTKIGRVIGKKMEAKFNPHLGVTL